MSKINPDMDELSYANRENQKDVEKRIQMLFHPEQSEDGSADPIKEAYETVNEDETTDTTDGPDDDVLNARTSEAKRQFSAADRNTSKSTEPKKAVEEGIKSSDEEEEGAQATAAAN